MGSRSGLASHAEKNEVEHVGGCGPSSVNIISSLSRLLLYQRIRFHLIGAIGLLLVLYTGVTAETIRVQTRSRAGGALGGIPVELTVRGVVVGQGTTDPEGYYTCFNINIHAGDTIEARVSGGEYTGSISKPRSVEDEDFGLDETLSLTVERAPSVERPMGRTGGGISTPVRPDGGESWVWSGKYSLNLIILLVLLMSGSILCLLMLIRSRRAKNGPVITNRLARRRSKDPTLPRDFGPYVLQDVVAEGGHSVIYQAKKHGSNDVLALKIPKGECLATSTAKKRFLKETKLGKTLVQDNIVRIFDVGEIDGQSYFTMELIEGNSLKELLETTDRFAPRFATRIVMKVAQALDYAHAKDVTHNDLKPGNIMVQLHDLNHPAVQLIDFGIAGDGTEDSLVGTPPYMSPEQARRNSLGPRSDLFALGVILHEMLTGHQPIPGPSRSEMIEFLRSEQPVPVQANIDAFLRDLLNKMLAKSSGDRPDGASEVVNALRQFEDR